MLRHIRVVHTRARLQSVLPESWCEDMVQGIKADNHGGTVSQDSEYPDKIRDSYTRRHEDNRGTDYHGSGDDSHQELIA